MRKSATNPRRDAMAIIARADAAELEAIVGSLPSEPMMLRSPEVGLVMVRGRIGGDGRAFNLGEATVTRAAVRFADGPVGYGHVLGRAPDKARLAAIVDALWQTPEYRPRIEAGLAEVARRLAAESATDARRTAATRVDFFTMVRGS